MKIVVRMQRVRRDYAIVEVDVRDDDPRAVATAKRKARAVVRREPSRFCDGDDLPVEITQRLGERVEVQPTNSIVKVCRES